jgi:hypothetical protein
MQKKHFSKNKEIQGEGGQRGPIGPTSRIHCAPSGLGKIEESNFRVPLGAQRGLRPTPQGGPKAPPPPGAPTARQHSLLETAVVPVHCASKKGRDLVTTGEHVKGLGFRV